MTTWFSTNLAIIHILIFPDIAGRNKQNLDAVLNPGRDVARELFMGTGDDYEEFELELFIIYLGLSAASMTIKGKRS